MTGRIQRRASRLMKMADSLLATIFFAVTLTLAVCDNPNNKTVTNPSSPSSAKSSIPGAVLQSVREYQESLTLVIKGPAGPGQTQNSDNNGNDVNAPGSVLFGSIPGAVLQSVTVEDGSASDTNGSLPLPFASIPGAVLMSSDSRNDNSTGADD